MIGKIKTRSRIYNFLKHNFRIKTEQNPLRFLFHRLSAGSRFRSRGALRRQIFYRDIFLIGLSAFGGGQAHLALFREILVRKRNYLNDKELIELFGLCQFLPGPSSGQIIAAIGYKIGGAMTAFTALFIWCLPAFVLMTGAAMVPELLGGSGSDSEWLRFLRPAALGFVLSAGFGMMRKTVSGPKTGLIALAAAVFCFFFRTPWTFPAVLLTAGALAAFTKSASETPAGNFKIPLSPNKRYLFLYIGFFLTSALIGGLTYSLPVRLFENFYRNGSLIFGGGYVLLPALYNEFVEFKHYLTSDEFVAGFAFLQTVPGPVFSFASYIGGLAMRDYGAGGVILGGLVALLGINLPGIFLILFVMCFWDRLKQYGPIRAALVGINAAGAGMIAAAALILAEPLCRSLSDTVLAGLVFLLMRSGKIAPPYLIAACLLLGGILQFFG